MKVAYGEIHRYPGYAEFTDEFLERLKVLGELIAGHGGDIGDTAFWTERLFVKVSYGTRGEEDSRVKYMMDGKYENTQLLIDITQNGSIPYSYWEEGESAMLGLGLNVPSIEEMPDIYFADDFIENCAMMINSIRMYCYNPEVKGMMLAMPEEHRRLLDEAVSKEVQDNLSRYKDLKQDALEIELACAIEDVANKNEGKAVVSLDASGASERTLKSVEEALKSAMRDRGVKVVVLSSESSLFDWKEASKIFGTFDLVHHHWDLDAESKVDLCKEYGVNIHVDASEEVEEKLKDSPTEFFSLRMEPVW